MNFGQILDAVCKDGIDPSRRSDAGEWVRYRHAWLWGAEPWSFKQASGSITFTAGSQVAAAPADVHGVYAVYDAQGDPLRGIRDIRVFYDSYNTLTSTQSGSPEAYASVNGQILVGPKGDGTVGLILYEKSKPSLVADTDVTGLPDGFDLALVHGARAEGFRLTNVPLADASEADFTGAVQALQDDWLDVVLESGGQMGAYRPGLRQFAAWR